MRLVCFGLLTLVLISPACAAQPPGCDRDFETQEARYLNDGVRLAGLFFRPETARAVPAAVILQGSGTSGRSNRWSRMFAETLARCGIAALLTDKRGSDLSEGDWRTATFEELARDGRAGFGWLQAQPGVDPHRVGYLGLSQGGHVAPLAAELTPDVAFVVNAAGSALPMEQTLLHELEQTYEQHGLTTEQIAYLQTMAHAFFDYLRTGEGWQDYLAIRAEIAQTPLKPATETWPVEKDDWYVTFWGNIYDFDPMTHWRPLILERRVPSLVLYGERDEDDNVPVIASVARYEEAAAGGCLTIAVYPGVGHGLFKPDENVLLPAMVQDLVGFIRAAAPPS